MLTQSQVRINTKDNKKGPEFQVQLTELTNDVISIQLVRDFKVVRLLHSS